MYFTREDGVPLKVACTCVDSGYKSTVVYKYTTPRQRKPHRVYATKGHSTPWKPLNSAPSKVGPRRKTLLYMVGKEVAKESLFSRLQINEPGPGYCHFPLGRSAHYFEQITSEELKISFKKGRKTMTFEKKKANAPNEALDLRVGNMVALAILNPDFQILKIRNLKIAEKISGRGNSEKDPIEQTEDKQTTVMWKKKSVRRRAKGWVNGWR